MENKKESKVSLVTSLISLALIGYALYTLFGA
jgi:hypothetical protein